LLTVRSILRIIVGRLCEAAFKFEASDTDALQSILKQREKLGTRSRVLFENAKQT
jgi:hypothetical protein